MKALTIDYSDEDILQIIQQLMQTHGQIDKSPLIVQALRRTLELKIEHQKCRNEL